MAYYENLPIYRKAMELAVYLEQAVRSFPRYHKYSIGNDLRILSKGLVKRIVQVNSLQNKAEMLRQLRDDAEELKITIAICREIRAFRSFRQFERAAGLAVNLCRQSEGWLKSRQGKGSEFRRR